MMEDYFKEILNEYEKEKSKSFKNNNLVYKIRNDLPGEILKYVTNDFSVKAACGVNSWPESPWISIIHNSFESFQEALILQYNFQIEKSEMSLSMILRLKNSSEYIPTKEFLQNKLSNYDLKEFRLNKDNTSSIIISKSYTLNCINENQMKNDLDFICLIYKDLLKDFISFIRDDDTPKETAETLKIKDISVSYKHENVYMNNIDNPEEFFTERNINKIIKCRITIDEYREILFNIRNNSKLMLSNIINTYDIDLDKLQIKDKILLYSKSFTKTEYKSIGRILGSYSFNTIKIDDRLSNPLIITSMIHELSHYLVEKILKEILMKILESNDTALISSFIKILLEDNELNYLLDEFCAHTVEGRFTLYGYQDYSSFKFKFDEISDLYSKEDIEFSLIIANTFAFDIKEILEEFIDDDLREEIKDEFLKLNEPPKYDPLDLEIESRLENDDFIQAIAILLTSGVGEVLNSGDKLERYIAKYNNA